MKIPTLSALAFVLGTSVAYAQAPTGETSPAPTPAPAPAPGTPGAPPPTPPPTPAPTPPNDQASAPPANPATMTEEQKKAEARRLYEAGLSAYNLGNFDEAIKAFSDAYALSAAPGLLFNIAQSHRLKKDYERATYFYQTYLRLKPDAANRPDVENFLTEMAKLIEDQKKMASRPPEGTVTPEGGTQATAQQPVGPVDTPDPEAAKKAEKMMLIGMATAGGGAALVITGLIFGKLASNAESDLEGLNASHEAWTPAQQDRYDAGKRNNTIAIVSFVIGGAAIATGGTFYVLGMMKKKEANVAINPTPGGTTVAVGWSF